MKGLNFKLLGLFVLKSLYGSNNTNIYYLFRLKKETSQVLEAQWRKEILSFGKEGNPVQWIFLLYSGVLVLISTVSMVALHQKLLLSIALIHPIIRAFNICCSGVFHVVLFYFFSAALLSKTCEPWESLSVTQKRRQTPTELITGKQTHRQQKIVGNGTYGCKLSYFGTAILHKYGYIYTTLF